MSAFFHMGGYALYVWVSYGAVAAVFAAFLIVLSARKRRLLKRRDD